MDNKCSWVINTALVLTSPSPTPSIPFKPSTPFSVTPDYSGISEARKKELRKLLDENYGRKSKDSEEVVKKVYGELKIEKWYEEYEGLVVGEIRRMIENLDEKKTALKKEVFTSFLHKIYKRSK